MESKTDIIRDEIEGYLKRQGIGVKVREADLTRYLMKNCTVATGGIIRGIFNRAKGIGSYRAIPNVKMSKEGAKVFYHYQPNNSGFSEDSTIGKLRKKTIEFEKSLKAEALWNISILDLPLEERKPYLEYMDKFGKFRNMFVEKNSQK